MNAIEVAVNQVGLQRLANAVGVRYQAVQQWCRRGEVPLDRCPAIERATDGAVSCEQLRTDVFWVRDESGSVTAYTVPVMAAEEAA